MCDDSKKNAFETIQGSLDYGTLRPTTSEWTGRYEKHVLASLKQAIVTPGYWRWAETKPSYLPPCWSSFVHPEGQIYFARDSPLRIVTEAYLYNPETLAKVLYWSKHIESLVEEKGMPLSENIELFILIEDDGCSYYFVNHAIQTQFWLEQYDTTELGIPDVASESHLQIALTELYWIHVEYFPMHIGGLPVKVVDDLLSIWCHGLTDQITSQTSTYLGLWSREECYQLLDLLKIARDNMADGNQICVVARLWRSIYHHRFQSHHGQEVARLSRDQAILHHPLPSPRLSTVLSILTLNTATRHHTQLTDTFIDQLVYKSQWQPFIRRTVEEWKRASFEAFCILLLHIFLLHFPSSSTLGVTSAVLLVASILSSALLRHRYNSLEDASAGDIYTHLHAMRSEKYDFHFVALIYSLPTAFQLWGLLLFCTNVILILSVYVGMYWVVGATVFISALALSLNRTTITSSLFHLRNFRGSGEDSLV
ncbi:hypothetical protein E1B28_006136 [Marasmius oreades]|uniref:WW domain-containing protein n=1 Tax=Marasmius oreades TaxID=181124 RepID=A0A9P7S4M8_9AGAR|nr:uncharacterized protein E1B28_006136 [Marasmius oreades]KAG7095379.1 hypothetical protein E1B28_006136 [Marasmius oreades]